MMKNKTKQTHTQKQSLDMGTPLSSLSLANQRRPEFRWLHNICLVSPTEALYNVKDEIIYVFIRVRYN